MIIQDTSASLLLSDDKECVPLFIEFIKSVYNISDAKARLISEYFVIGKWKYVYMFNKNTMTCSSEPMIFQKSVIEENEIICFIDDKYNKGFRISDN